MHQKYYYKAVKAPDGTVQILNRDSNKVTATYYPAEDKLQMHDLGTIADSEWMLAEARKCAGWANLDPAVRQQRLIDEFGGYRRTATVRFLILVGLLLATLVIIAILIHRG